MNARIVELLIGSVALAGMMGVGLSAAPSQVAGGVPQPPTAAGDPVPAPTPAEIMTAFSAAMVEADREQAKRDRAELDDALARVYARIAALPMRSCGLSVAWTRYTARFAKTLEGLTDAPDPLATAEREHAMAGLQELDRLITSAATSSADVCSDDRELAELKRATQGHRTGAQARLGRVADAVCSGARASDRATLTALIHRHRPAGAEIQTIYDKASVDLLDEIGRLRRSRTLCSTRSTRALLKRLPAIVVENFVSYSDPVGVKTVENVAIREQLQRGLDRRGANLLRTYVGAGPAASFGEQR